MVKEKVFKKYKIKYNGRKAVKKEKYKKQNI